MQMILAKINYILFFFPAFSIIYLFSGIHVQNRMLLLIIIPMILPLIKINIQKYQVPMILLVLFFSLYTIIAFCYQWQFIIYFGYFSTFFLILLTIFVIHFEEEHFIQFFKIFFYANIFYAILQLILLNLGLESLTMLHSNIPVQENYTIPIFIAKPFYRYTGLFNESSPFAFYLIICFSFFSAIGRKYRKLKACALFFLSISGAKIAYLFIVLHYMVFSKSRVIKIISISLFAITMYLYFFELQTLINLTYGEIASVLVRAQGFEFKDSFWGTGLGKSSEGELALNMISILISGFGYLGSLFIVSCIIAFYALINNRSKKFFILPFFVGVLSNGSLLIVQYTLIIYCLIYLHHNKISISQRKKEVEKC